MKNINTMSLEEIELELGNEVSDKIRKHLLVILYEKKLQERK